MTTPTPSQFIQTLTKISVSQILNSTGFKSANSSALDSLTRITTLFLHHLSTSAASRAENPSVPDIVSAIEELNFALDFSIPQLTGFIICPDHQPFCRRVPKPELLKSLPEHVESTTSRGPEVPSWLPAFPRVDKSDDDLIGDNLKVGKELYWEKSCVIPKLVKTNEVAKEKAVRKRKRGAGEIIVYCRRKRLKFRLEGRKKAKAGNVDDLEFRNGVCRGGKRVGLVRQVSCNRFFQDDDDDDEV